jgi:hypothetical protein
MGAGMFGVVAVSIVPRNGVAVAADPVKDGVVVKDRRLTEISGCGVSPLTPNIIWVHNDSGDAARAYAISTTSGQTLLTVNLKDTEATDNEDMDIYDGHVYLADIGDNKAKRTSIRVSSFAEPTVPAQGAKAARSVSVAPITRMLTYEDGPHDAEAFLVDPTGAMVIVTKTDGHVYRADRDDVLRSVLKLDLPLVTGATRSVDGRMVLLRTYLSVLRFDRPAKGSFDDVWKSKAKVVAGPLLAQAEAICIEPNGAAAWTTSESNGGAVRLFRLPLH